MKTLELKISDALFDQVVGQVKQALQGFPREDVRVMQKDEKRSRKQLAEAVRKLRESARETGLDQISDAEIDAEIAAHRAGS
ncbi:MAG: hypothetical protein HQL63_07750 [Magnetococcales bacterium]|nr:hypothetical protein [Magnetococcales bacterium]